MLFYIIENIVTTHDDIYKVLTESGYKSENAKEVVDYRNAIWTGYELIKKDNFINTNTLVKIQEIIEHNKAGKGMLNTLPIWKYSSILWW